MSDWAEVVDFVANSKNLWRTMRAEGSGWQDRLAARKAVEGRRRVVGRVQRVAGAQGAGTPIGTRDQEWRLWCGGGLLLRSEYFIGKELITVVAQGPRWWRWSRTLGATSGGGPGRPVRYMLGPAGVLVDTASLIENIEGDKIADSLYLGRKALTVSAHPTADRPRARMALREAGTGADEYEIVVDAERGVLLSVIAKYEGQPFRSVAISEIGFDEAFSPQVFSPQTPGEEPPTIARPMRKTTIAELTSAVDFPILVPNPSPSPVEPHVVVFDSDRRGLGPRRVVLTYAIVEETGRGQLRITVAGSPLPRAGDSWEIRDGMEVNTERFSSVIRSRVRSQIGATSVELESSVLNVDRLIAIAGSLAPISPDQAALDNRPPPP